MVEIREAREYNARPLSLAVKELLENPDPDWLYLTQGVTEALIEMEKSEEELESTPIDWEEHQEMSAMFLEPILAGLWIPSLKVKTQYKIMTDSDTEDFSEQSILEELENKKKRLEKLMYLLDMVCCNLRENGFDLMPSRPPIRD